MIRAMKEQFIPSDRESHETLRGGERVLIRRARPDDVAAYRDFVRHVDAEDLRLRFFAHIAELTDAEADKLSHLDYAHDIHDIHDMTFVALDEESGEMLGLVRLRDELDEETAEYAILVRSRLKSHGLGYLLMQRVIQYAKDKNLRRVYGDVLAENTMMLQMAGELGFHIEDIGSGLKRVVLNLRPAARS
jgi:acetyltransferase